MIENILYILIIAAPILLVLIPLLLAIIPNKKKGKSDVKSKDNNLTDDEKMELRNLYLELCPHDTILGEYLMKKGILPQSEQVAPVILIEEQEEQNAAMPLAHEGTMDMKRENILIKLCQDAANFCEYLIHIGKKTIDEQIEYLVDLMRIRATAPLYSLSDDIILSEEEREKLEKKLKEEKLRALIDIYIDGRWKQMIDN